MQENTDKIAEVRKKKMEVAHVQKNGDEEGNDMEV